MKKEKTHKEKSCMNYSKKKIVVSHTLVVSIKNILSVSECFIYLKKNERNFYVIQVYRVNAFDRLI